MKQYLILRTLLFFILLFPAYSNASHIIGGEIEYKYIGDSTGTLNEYLLMVNLYHTYSTSGPGMPNSIFLDVSNNCLPTYQLTLSRYLPAGSVPAGDGGHFPDFSECAILFNQNIAKVSVHSYRIAAVLSGTCMYTFTTKSLPRQFTANLNPYNGDLYISAGMAKNYGRNNSMKFEQYSNLYICKDQLVISNYHTINDTGDSIYYKLATPQGANGVKFNYTSGYSQKSPITTHNGTYLDSINGVLYFSPDTNLTVAVKVRAFKYRKDTVINQWGLMGYIERDVNYNIRADCHTSIMDINFSKDTLGFDSVATVYCKDEQFVIYSDPPYIINSLQTDGSDFKVIGTKGNIYQIASVSSIDSLNSIYAKGIKIQLLDSIKENDTLSIFPQKGSDSLSLINHCGFEMDSSEFVMVTALDTCVENTVNIIDQNSLSTLRIYPNPSDENISLYLSSLPPDLDLTLKIADLRGKILWNKNTVRSQNTDYQIDISQLSSGWYLLGMGISNENIVWRRFLKL